MGQTEAQHVITEVVTQLKASFEPRFDRVEADMKGLTADVKGLKHRMLTLEEAVEDMRLEQRLIRQAAISNLSDITRLTDRLERG
jgi:DNA-binding transcriptional regulator YbjK